MGCSTKRDVAREVLNQRSNVEMPTLVNSPLDISFETQVFCLMWRDALQAPRESVIFYDYALPDNIAFWQIAKKNAPEAIMKSALVYSYNHIFMLEPLCLIYDGVRKESQEEQHEIFDIQKKIYRDLGYTFSVLSNTLDSRERAAYILEHLDLIKTPVG
jgi:predicted ATPase